MLCEACGNENRTGSRFCDRCGSPLSLSCPACGESNRGDAMFCASCGGELHAIEDRCSHDDGPLCEGEWDPDVCEVVCPRHGSRFDLRTGNALTLPAYLPVATYPVRVREDGMVVIELGTD